MTDEDISSTPLTPRIAASTRCVTCVSSSVGAAPGWTTTTCTAGNSMSGWSFTSIRLKLTIPASRSEEHTSELQSLMRISYAVFCLKKKKHHSHQTQKPHTSE